jgi:hypothetical protein
LAQGVVVLKKKIRKEAMEYTDGEGKMLLVGREGKRTHVPFQEAHAPPKKPGIGASGTAQPYSSSAMHPWCLQGREFSAA